MTAGTLAANRPTPPEAQSILLQNVSWKTYELLLRDLQEEHVFLTYDTGLLEIDRRGVEVGVLEPISVETYESLLHDLSDQNIRLTYDHGRLWIVSPTHRHDKYKKLLGRMLESLALELEIEISCFGSATWRPLEGIKGLESDECYYIQNEPRVRGKDEIDLTRDPPPDLAIEVEITNPLIDRLAIYAALGVPELWHWHKDQLRALKLEAGKFVPIEFSLAFPWLRPSELTRFLEMRQSKPETSIMKEFLKWVRSQRP